MDQELDLYMQTYTEMAALLKRLDEDQIKAEHITKSQYGERLAHLTLMMRLMLQQHKMVLDQLTRMNNIFGQRDPVD